MDSATPFQPWTANDNAKKDKELVDDAKHNRENVNHPKHTQTASYDKDTAVASGNVPGSSSATGPCGDSAESNEVKMDSNKIASMQQIVENTLSPEARQRVSQLLEAVEALSGTERLLLYLRLPTGVPLHDPLKQPVNPLGSRAELQQTVTWIQTHLEVDPDVSLPKQDVYDEYIAHCMSSNMKPLSTADFGKVMKQVYPSVRPRRLGTRGNSRYCYAGLRKKIKLEVPQLPDLGESSKESTAATRETERLICDWAESKLGVKFNNLSELSRHLLAATASASAPRSAVDTTPPPLPTHPPAHGPSEDPASRHLINQLKRKIQTHGTPGRPKKYKGPELVSECSPSTSYAHHPVKHEGEPTNVYEYSESYVPMYDVRAPYQYPYRPEPYPAYPPRDVPINLSTDATLERERADWQRRRPPDPPPAPRLPGKKLILETYQSEVRQQPTDEFPRTEYLPKKMRAAEISGGKLAAARQALVSEASTSTVVVTEPSVRSEVAFLEDPKNVSSRSKSTAAALAREEQEAASPTMSVGAPTPKCQPNKQKDSRSKCSPERSNTPDSCCGLDGINIKTGMICEEKHSEILNRERVISICNIDKHDLDGYLYEGNSQENEEELLQYFHPKVADSKSNNVEASTEATNFLEPGLDPQDDHSQNKNDKICQLRELLVKNLKNQSVSNYHNSCDNLETQNTHLISNHNAKPGLAKHIPTTGADGAFKPVTNSNAIPEIVNGPSVQNSSLTNCNNPMKSINSNGLTMNKNNISEVNVPATPMYNGNCHNVPQSPTTRTQQYDFVPISDGCHSPRNFNSKSPVGFCQRSLSPSKTNKSIVMGGSLQTSPISHSTAASPFVSPRNTPVPRSRLCPRPIPKPGRKRRSQLSLGMNDIISKQFATPNDQKYVVKSACVPGVKYCQPMSAPPSPNIITSQYKNQMFYCSGISNGNHNLSLNFFPHPPYREINGDLSQPLSADPLSSEVSQFFQDPLVNYRAQHDPTFRSQSVPLKQGINNMGIHNYKTPVGSVPPTPVPNEFCDFGSLADTCDISKAGLNSETLDKIYNAIDSSNDVLNPNPNQSILHTNGTNGCEILPEQQILSDELNSLLPGDELLETNGHYNQTFGNESSGPEDVEDFLKRTNSLEYDLSSLVSDKNKYCLSRSVPSTPLPYKRTIPNLQIDPRRSRELFAADYIVNGISSKSVPSTPQLVDEKNVFSYSNRDFLINGNSVETCSSSMHSSVVATDQTLDSPLQEILREDVLEPLNPAADLLADLDKIEGPPYVDL